MCGFEFDENKLENRGCSSCGKHNCNQVHCPNCGFGNSLELDEEFELTENEYNCFAREVRKKRADEVINSIKQLSEIIGVAEVKSMIRTALREI